MRSWCLCGLLRPHDYPNDHVVGFCISGLHGHHRNPAEMMALAVQGKEGSCWDISMAVSVAG